MPHTLDFDTATKLQMPSPAATESPLVQLLQHQDQPFTRSGAQMKSLSWRLNLARGHSNNYSKRMRESMRVPRITPRGNACWGKLLGPAYPPWEWQLQQQVGNCSKERCWPVDQAALRFDTPSQHAARRKDAGRHAVSGADQHAKAAVESVLLVDTHLGVGIWQSLSHTSAGTTANLDNGTMS